MMYPLWSRARTCYSRLLLVLVLFICTESHGQYSGDSLLNVVEVGKDYKLDDIKEIKYFTALYTEGKDDLTFMLALDDEVPLDHPDGGLSPALFLRHDGKDLASVQLLVRRSEVEQAHMLSWHAVPAIADESFCLVQVYPNREQMATLKIPFSIATIKWFDSKNEKVHRLTFDEVRRRQQQVHRKREQGNLNSGAANVDDEPNLRRVKRIMISPKTADSPRKVTLHTFAAGVFDAEGRFQPATTMPFKVGAEFGYELEVYSPKGNVHVKEVLDLPAPGVWNAGSEIDKIQLDGVTMLDVSVENGNKTQVQEYELQGGQKSVAFGQVYEIVEGDPQGEYRFRIYLNGQLAGEATLQVGEE